MSRSRPSRKDIERVDLLRSAVTRLARSQRAAGARTHETLPFSLMSTLSALERLGSLTPTELAALEGVSKPTMTRSLATLEERGYTVLTSHPTDARQKVVSVSEEGKRAVKATREHVNQWYLDRLNMLPADERRLIQDAAGALRNLADNTL